MRKLDRRDFMKTMGFFAAGLSFNACQARAAYGKSAGSRPNILFIMSDDQAAHSIGAYGGRFADLNPTPRLDELAAEGMRFNDCFVTNSICGPSRACILTGKYSHMNGYLTNRSSFDSSQVTLPKLLQNAGYETAIFGKWHIPCEPTDAGFGYWQVFDGHGDYYNPEFIEMNKRKMYRGYSTDIITDLSTQWLDQTPKDQPFCLMCHFNAPHRFFLPGEDHIHDFSDTDFEKPPTWQQYYDNYPGYCDAIREADVSIAEHMDNRDAKLDLDKNFRGRPQYSKDLDIRKLPGWPDNYKAKIEAYKNPWPDQEQLSYQKARKKNLPRGLDEQQRKVWESEYGPIKADFSKANLKDKELHDWKFQRFTTDYLRCVKSIDDNVGRLLDHLESRGLADNTIVLFTSDQGYILGEHGIYTKRFMYEESIRMPLIVRYPGQIEEGSVNNDIVLNVDFAPTLLEYAGITPPAEMQGKSLKQNLTGKTPKDWRKSMYYQYYEFPVPFGVKKHYGIRTHEHKLIHYYHDIDCWELFDLKKDPLETNNVYSEPKYENIVEELKQNLCQLRKDLKTIE